MRKGGMETQGRLFLRAPRLWNEPSIRARVDELAGTCLGREEMEIRLGQLSRETGFETVDLLDLLGVAQCWRELHAEPKAALAA